MIECTKYVKFQVVIMIMIVIIISLNLPVYHHEDT